MFLCWKIWADNSGLINYKRACFYVAEHGYYVRTIHQQNTFEKYIFDGITKAGFDVLFARGTRESSLVILPVKVP